MKRLTDLAQSAVGFDASRGDQVSVEELAFDDNAVAPETGAGRAGAGDGRSVGVPACAMGRSSTALLRILLLGGAPDAPRSGLSSSPPRSRQRILACPLRDSSLSPSPGDVSRATRSRTAEDSRAERLRTGCRNREARSGAKHTLAGELDSFGVNHGWLSLPVIRECHRRTHDLSGSAQGCDFPGGGGR